ncbi:50S ribosomal protein L22 [Sedimentisphaera cyanobacteriorum]|uniref:Large ribosomal subunit protein uL22 n=1 Tax=Sedimentisphaera cyanobacteriorum TaxID=1940790 RepID=A0A1Q2HQA0_9BACT|nr:50S ribosomal protein L22 [Sedimentisphaera cyanobacteriorum]AQQ09426.1 50S ribosomal protein L22 [Sedimentisphaera cyanobacteriorum]
MLNVRRLNEIIDNSTFKVEDIASSLESTLGGSSKKAVKNWKNGLMKPQPKNDHIDALAQTLNVDASELKAWNATFRYAPQSARKVRLVADLIRGRHVRDAEDILKFTPKRSASMILQVLKSAVANADEEEADVETLYVAEARVDGAGRRIGTKGFIPKDRGRAHPIRKEACHIYVTVAQFTEE